MNNRQLRRAVKNIRLKGQFLRGLLGDFSGTIEVAGRPGYYYVRVEKPGGYEVGIFPGRVRALKNLPVRLETHPITGIQYIVGLDDETIAYGGTAPSSIPAMERHALTHGWGGDDMLMWLHTAQVFPLRCQPHESISTSVVIQAGTYFSEGLFCALAAPLAVSLVAYIPSNGYKYVLLYLNAAGAAGIVDNGAQRLSELNPAPSGTYWVAALRLAAGTAIGWQSIIDLRFMNSGVINGGELQIGTDYITVGTNHPDIWGRWTRIGHQLDTLLCSTRATGMTATDDSDYMFVGMNRVGSDDARAVILFGDNADNSLYFIYRPSAGCQTLLGVLDSTGDLWLLGDVKLEAGNTVDGVDVSAHRHDGVLGGPQIPFLNLSDTPNNYIGMAGRVASVKLDETGLEFTTGGGGGGGTYPTPTGLSVYPILFVTQNVTDASYAEVDSVAGNITRFPLNERYLPENASVRLVVRAATAGTGYVRLAYAGSSGLPDSAVYVTDVAMDDPPMSNNFRANLINEDSDSVFCLEAETDGVNTMTLYAVWLLVEW